MIRKLQRLEKREIDTKFGKYGTWGSQSLVAKDSDLLRCYAALIGN
jgi:hypothetical protein